MPTPELRALIVFGLLAVLVTIFIVVRYVGLVRWSKGLNYDPSVMDNLIAPLGLTLFVAAALFMFTSLIMYESSPDEDLVWTEMSSRPLHTLVSASDPQASFFLIAGMAGESEVYRFLAQEDSGGLKMDEVDMQTIEIFTGEPRIVEGYWKSPRSSAYGGTETRIYVPEGSIAPSSFDVDITLGD